MNPTINGFPLTTSGSAYTLSGDFVVRWNPPMPPWPGDDGTAGDREPRRPKPSPHSSGMALDLPISTGR